jgi:4-amino-4-deoxy-L-arabinose transferase-like glycosyltransferase
MLKRIPVWAALLIAVFLLYGVSLYFARDLWVQDEARYGEVVREMVQSGHYFVPTLDGKFYPDKPPLYFWLMVLQTRLTGLNTMSFRLFTLAQMLAFAGAFFVFARRLLGDSRGLWAVLIVLTSQLFLITGNVVRMDILLAALVVLSLHFLLRAAAEDRPRLALAGYGCAILATMVKGPLGFAFPVLAAAVYAFTRERFWGLRRLNLLGGVRMALVVGLVWTGYLYATGQGAYVGDVALKQIWGRAVGSWSHPQPPYFYALVLLPLFMPWLPFVRRAVAAAPGEIVRIALCWFVPGFLLISAISGKLFVYLVPLFPPLALLVAAGLPAPWEAPPERPVRGAGLITALFYGAAGGGLLYALVRYLPGEFTRMAPVAAAFIALGLVVALLALRGRTRGLLWALLAGSCLISSVALGWGAGQLNAYFSARELGLRLADYKRAGYQVASVDVAPGTLSFYGGCQVRGLSAAELGRALDEPGRLAVAVRNKKRALIPAAVLARLAVVESFPKLEFEGYGLYVERLEIVPTAPRPVQSWQQTAIRQNISLAFRY